MSMIGKRAVGCVTYLRTEWRDGDLLWDERTPLVIERIAWNKDKNHREYWVTDKFRNIRPVHDYQLQDPYGYYEDSEPLGG